MIKCIILAAFKTFLLGVKTLPRFCDAWVYQVGLHSDSVWLRRRLLEGDSSRFDELIQAARQSGGGGQVGTSWLVKDYYMTIFSELQAGQCKLIRMNKL